MTAAAPAPSMVSSPVVLATEDLAVHYGGIKAVDGIDLTVPAGTIVGLLGPNGSGKSTLLAALTRFVPLTRGRMLLDGDEFSHIKSAKLAARGVARTFQTVRLLPDLTVVENVQLGADLHPRRGPRGWIGRTVAESVNDAIDRTGLSDHQLFRPGELSYGMQRRVEIARALATRPRLLLLDEPTAGMNQSERHEVSALLRKLRDEGLTQLLVEHDVAMMVDTCDRLLAMVLGRVVAQGMPGDVVRNPAVQEAYLGKGFGSDA